MKKYFYLLLILAGHSPAKTFTYPECVDQLAKGNAELKAAEMELVAFAHKREATWGNFLPQVFAALDYAKIVKIDEQAKEQAGTYTTSVTGKQNIFNGFKSISEHQQASANYGVAVAKLQTIKAKVSYDFRVGYANYVYARDYESLTNNIILRRNDNLRVVELQFESGRENKGSVLWSKAYVNQAEYDQMQASNRLRVAKVALRALLNLADEENFEVNGAFPSSEDSKKDAGILPEIAITTPTYLQAIATEQAAHLELTASRSAFFPSLDLTGKIYTNETTPSANFQNWSIGVNFTLPLFDGFKDYFNQQSAVADWKKATYSQVLTKQNVLTNLEETWATLREARQKYKVDESFRAAALVRAEVARKKYHNGLMSFDDWDNIENDLIMREKNFLLSKQGQVIAEANWEQVRGKGVFQ